MVEIKPEDNSTQPEVELSEELTVTRTDVEFENGVSVTDLPIVEEFKNGNIFGKIVPF